MSEHDLEDAIATTLRAKASADVDTARLLLAAGTRGRTLVRRRRRMVLAGAVVGATLVLAGTVTAVSTVLPGVFDSTPAGESPTSIAPPPASTVPSLPAAADQPGATQRPDLVGKDPSTVHFTVDLPASTPWASWEVGRDIEQLMTHLAAADGKPGTEVKIGVGRDLALLDEAGTVLGLPLDGPPVTEPTTVDGRPATLERQRLGGRSGGSAWALRWQPVDGLWVRLDVMGDASANEVLSTADLLHLDRAQRCVVPFRFTNLPPGAVASSCRIRLGREPGVGTSDPEVAVIHARVDFTDAQGNTLAVDALQAGRKLAAPNRSVAGRPAQWGGVGPIGGSLVFQNFDGLALSVDIMGQLGEDVAVRIAETLRVAPDLNNPQSWPG